MLPTAFDKKKNQELERNSIGKARHCKIRFVRPQFSNYNLLKSFFFLPKFLRRASKCVQSPKLNVKRSSIDGKCFLWLPGGLIKLNEKSLKNSRKYFDNWRRRKKLLSISSKLNDDRHWVIAKWSLFCKLLTDFYKNSSLFHISPYKSHRQPTKLRQNMSIKISNNIGFCVHKEFFKLSSHSDSLKLGLILLFQIMFRFYTEEENVEKKILSFAIEDDQSELRWGDL